MGPFTCLYPLLITGFGVQNKYLLNEYWFLTRFRSRYKNRKEWSK